MIRAKVMQVARERGRPHAEIVLLALGVSSWKVAISHGHAGTGVIPGRAPPLQI